MKFGLNLTALGMAIGALFLYFFFKSFKKQEANPYLLYPYLLDLRKVAKGGRLLFRALPSILLTASLFFFATAFVDPKILLPGQKNTDGERPKSEPTQGIAIYLLLDQSGSMGESITISNREGNREKVVKIDLLKKVTLGFVKGDTSLGLAGRPNDMVGIVALGRKATIIAPLTLDHQAILEKIAQLPLLSSPEEGGTVIGYGIFKTANLIAATKHYAEGLTKNPAYSIKTNVIILITDGLQDPNPLDQNKPLRMIEIPDAAQYARQVGVKLYIININPDLAKPEFAAVRQQMTHASELTGGKFYLAQGTQELADIYAEIDKLEKSDLPTLTAAELKKREPYLYQTFFLSPSLIAAGLLALFVSLLLETTLLRKFP